MKSLLWTLMPAVLALAAAPASPAAETVRPDAPEHASGPGIGPDLLTPPAPRATAPARRAPGGIGRAPAVSEDDVYDTDSFGRSLRWLGSAQMNLALDAGPCAQTPPGTTVGSACVELQPAPATTTFALQDVARIRLPKGATHSMLCHWFSPYNRVTYLNPNPAGGVGVVARLWYQPTLTVENPLLDDPALIDSTTGLPFDGRLTVPVSNHESVELPLPADTRISRTDRDTATCIGGFVTKRALQVQYGLTEAQAGAFFDHPMTIRMNVSGGAQYVEGASLIFGLRIIGD